MAWIPIALDCISSLRSSLECALPDGPFWLSERQSSARTISLAALALAFLVCWAIKTTPEIQKLVLADGHCMIEIRAYLTLIQIISLLLLAIFSLLLLAHVFPVSTR